MGDPRRVTQELAEVEYTPDPIRRVTQELAEVEYQPDPIRRVTQIIVEVEYLVPPDEDQTQIRGHDQIQPWSVTSDRLSQEVAGPGLRGGGPEGPLWVDAAIYPQPTVQGQALISNATPQWTSSLTPTWLGLHTFNAGLTADGAATFNAAATFNVGLGIAAAQAITMGDEAYIGCGPADVRIVFDSGNDIALMGGNVGIKVAAPSYTLELGGETVQYPAAIFIQPTGHAVSERASIYLDDWQLGQDAAGDGVKNFYIYGNASERLRMLPSGWLRIGLTGDPTRQFQVVVDDSATNAVTYAQRLSHFTDGTVVAGFGTGIEFELEENDGSNRVAATIEVKWSDAGEGANADAYFDFKTMLNDGAVASRMVVGYNGVVGMGTPTPDPSFGLDLVGSLRLQGGPRIIVFNNGADQIDGIQQTAGAGSSLQLHGNHVTILTGGNMGVGIVNPGSPLTIEGTTEIRSGGLLRLRPAGNGYNWDLQGIGNDLAFTGGATERGRWLASGNLGIGVNPADRLLHVEVADSGTNAVIYAQRLSHVTDGTVTALFGVGLEMELEDAGGNNRVASMYDTLWADPAAATHTSLLRWQNTHKGAQAGFGGFVAADDVDGNAVTVVPNGAGDVAVTLTVVYSVSESDGGTAGGTATVLNNSSVDLYDDGTDVLILAVAADGSATLQRTAGAALFDVSLWMVWL